MKNIKLLFILVCILMTNSIKAQDIHFSQFYENGILRNPALTGIFSGDYKVGVNYRTQWSNVAVPFQTMLVSAETRVAISREIKDYFSFGVTATYDKAGSINFNSMQVYPAINYNKSMDDKHNSFLSVGFTAGYIQRSIDLSKATYSSQYVNGSYDPSNASGENLNNTTIQNYDFGAGISFNSSAGQNNNVTYYLGAAAYHIAKPRHNFNGYDYRIRLNTKWVGNLGVNYSINDVYSVTLHANYEQQNPNQEIMAGGLVSWRNAGLQQGQMKQYFALYLGAFVRVGDALIPTVKIDYQNLSLTASYDMTTSSLNPATGGNGGAEISLFVRGLYKRGGRPGASYDCPRFESGNRHY